MYKFLKPFLFNLDPEDAHTLTMRWLLRMMQVPGFAATFKRIFVFEDQALHKQVAGLYFKNPVGLAAGFDKDGKYMHAMAMLGFSHLELGTVTPRPQPGNPRPRLFRLVRSRALINRMGFNNEGAPALAERLKKGKPQGLIIGANIGKNKDTLNENATNDYLACFTVLYEHVDYFTINVSSPNTPGLRSLQDKEPLTALLSTLQAHNQAFKPIFLKIAPDLSVQQLDEIIEIVIATKLSGVIATNTTVTRDHLREDLSVLNAIGNGGLSGAPLLDKAVHVVSYLSAKSQKKFAIIGVGGIEDQASAKKFLDAGADLIQVYTGMIFTGPELVKQILKNLVRR